MIFTKIIRGFISPEHRRCAIDLRDMISRLEQIQLYLELGEYQRGESHENDRALDKKEQIEAFLKQAMDEPMSFDNILSNLNELAS
ncbi:hypothetical protein AB7W56_13565 [Providencia rettgeri]